MKNIMYRFLDWKKEIVQFCLLAAVFLFVMFADIEGIMVKAGVKFEDLCILARILIAVLGRVGICAILIYGLESRVIWRANKKSVLKQNTDGSVWHSYFGYWVCRNVLGYQTVSLVRVPIPVQFKLAYKGLFKDYFRGDDIRELEEGNDEVRVNAYNDGTVSDTVNLVLADTYPLDWEKQLPPSVLNLPTVVIDRFRERGVRFYSHDFVDCINTAFHELSHKFTSFNIFATTNPEHVYRLATEVFNTAGRDNVQRIRVYQQNGGTWNFDEKNHLDIKVGG